MALSISEALKANRKANADYKAKNPSTYNREDKEYQNANDLAIEEKSQITVRPSSKYGSLEFGGKRVYNFYCGTVSGFASQGVIDLLKEQKALGFSSANYSDCEVKVITDRKNPHYGKLSLQLKAGVGSFTSDIAFAND